MSKTNVATSRRSVQNTAKKTHNARARVLPDASVSGKDDRDDTEADQTQRDERVVNPEQLPNQCRQSGEVRPHVHDLGHEQAGAHETEVHHTGDLQQQRQTILMTRSWSG